MKKILSILLLCFCFSAIAQNYSPNCTQSTNSKILAGSNEGLIALTSDSVLNGTATAYVNVVAKGYYLQYIPEFADDLTQIDVCSNLAIGLHSDGSVVIWGSGSELAEGLTTPLYLNVSAISISISQVVREPHIILDDSTMFDMTSYGYGHSFAGIPGIVQVEGGNGFLLALLSDGTVISEGVGHPATNIPSELSNVIKIAAGNEHALALKSDGTVVSWGINEYNCTDVPTFLNNVIDIAAGSNRNLALKDDGTVVPWGWNGLPTFNSGWIFNTVPSNATDVIAIECSSNGLNAVLKSNGEVICWGYDHNNGHFNFPDINPFISDACGCTNSSAYNYSQNAIEDDGSCIETIFGCTDTNALNYNSFANIDIGSCISIEEYVIDSLEMVNQVLSDEAINIVSSLQQALESWNTTIDLDVGWNMFGYGCPSTIDVSEGLSNHTESIAIVKDNNGSVYMPEFSFNGIGAFTPGFGYQIKVTEAIEDFSLCDWYVNDIPEDNIVSLQEENASLQAELDSIYGCTYSWDCNYDETAILNDGSCYNNDLGCGCDVPGPIEGLDCDGNELPEYQVGDFAEGGIVFYVNETGEHGLVAAVEDLGLFEWGCYEEEVNGADETSIGTGYQNTLDIVIQGCVTQNGGMTAAQAALEAEVNGYSDWYLPSKDELAELINTVGQGGAESNGGAAGNFYTLSRYWSSSEKNIWHSWYIFYNVNDIYYDQKFRTDKVRPIRSF